MSAQGDLPIESVDWAMDIAEFVRKFEAAAPGELITYARGSDLVRGETSRQVTRLYDAGLADLRQRRVHGGFEYIVRKRPGTAAGAGAALAAREEDDALEKILHQLKREANMCLRCSSDTELARIAGLPTRNAAAWRIKSLKKAGIIRTSVEDGPDGPWRIVTIVETKAQTLLPPKLRALRRSVRAVTANDGPEARTRGRRWE